MNYCNVGMVRDSLRACSLELFGKDLLQDSNFASSSSRLPETDLDCEMPHYGTDSIGNTSGCVSNIDEFRKNSNDNIDEDKIAGSAAGASLSS